VTMAAKRAGRVLLLPSLARLRTLMISSCSSKGKCTSELLPRAGGGTCVWVGEIRVRRMNNLVRAARHEFGGAREDALEHARPECPPARLRGRGQAGGGKVEKNTMYWPFQRWLINPLASSPLRRSRALQPSVKSICLVLPCNPLSRKSNTQ
jgi:hypothetical protein